MVATQRKERDTGDLQPRVGRAVRLVGLTRASLLPDGREKARIVVASCTAGKVGAGLGVDGLLSLWSVSATGAAIAAVSTTAFRGLGVLDSFSYALVESC